MKKCSVCGKKGHVIELQDQKKEFTPMDVCLGCLIQALCVMKTRTEEEEGTNGK